MGTKCIHNWFNPTIRLFLSFVINWTKVPFPFSETGNHLIQSFVFAFSSWFILISRMIYHDPGEWILSLPLPQSNSFLYSFLVLNDLNKSLPPIWEPRIDRIYTPGQQEELLVWGVCLPFSFFYSPSLGWPSCQSIFDSSFKFTNLVVCFIHFIHKIFHNLS